MVELGGSAVNNLGQPAALWHGARFDEHLRCHVHGVR
jgi:hypothetical protein